MGGVRDIDATSGGVVYVGWGGGALGGFYLLEHQLFSSKRICVSFTIMARKTNAVDDNNNIIT